MISKEQIAHDLALTYLSNKYGVDVNGDFDISEGSGSGSVVTEHLPDLNAIKKVKVRTGERGFLGIEKKKTVEVGYEVNDVFANMIEDYYSAYARFFGLLNGKEEQ